MIRTCVFRCELPKADADALNRESGRIYTDTLVQHYRVLRKVGHWLSRFAGQRVEDSTGGATFLHAHSRDAAQDGFYEACRGAKAAKAKGLEAKYPRRRKRYRTTEWKSTGIRKRGEKLLLALARGHEPIVVELPQHLRGLPPGAFVEARLVYNKASRRYDWHLVIEDGVQPPEQPPGDGVAAVDLGEVHPATVSDGQDAAVISCRALRAVNQYTAKRLAAIQAKQAKCQPGSRRWRQLQQRKSRFLAEQEQRKRDLEHKVSREVVDWAVEHQVGTLAIGDVRDVGDGKRLRKEQQQKVSQWAHGRMGKYITYKAQAAGIAVVENVDEAYTSQTCPTCGRRHKPRGRRFACPACGLAAHRDVVGAVNILSRFCYGTLGNIPPPQPMYRHPFQTGKRSPSDTGLALKRACGSREREATRL